VDQFQYVVRMREAMEHGGNGSTIAEKLPHSSTGRFDKRSAGAPIAAHYDFQQVLGGGHG